MDIRKLKTLLSLMRKYDLAEMELSEEGQQVRFRKAGPAHPVPQAAARSPEAPLPAAPAPPLAPSEKGEKGKEKPDLLEVTSPLVGTFYRSPKPGDPSFVSSGSRVVKGDTLCIIEAMKVMNEIKSEFAGVVEEILSENGAPVEYGQVLIRIRP